jgi:hypothetical protein
MSGARQFSLKWQNPAARVPLREIVFADASPQTPGEHHHRSASPENGLIQDVLKANTVPKAEMPEEWAKLDIKCLLKGSAAP